MIDYKRYKCIFTRELFRPINGGRHYVNDLLILLTDGSQTPSKDAEDPGDIAEEIRKSGVEILVIGMN